MTIDRAEIWEHVAEILESRGRLALAAQVREPINFSLERSVVDAMCDAVEHHIQAAESRMRAFVVEAIDAAIANIKGGDNA